MKRHGSRQLPAWLIFDVGQKMKSPYSELRKIKTWGVISRAIRALEKNRDIVLQTKKEYVIGYLTSALERSPSKKASSAQPASRNSKKRS